MKKTALIMIASASMLFAALPMDNTRPMQGQSMGMKQGMKQIMPGKKCCRKTDMRMSRKNMDSPFLIKRGLPMLGKMILPYMDDPVFALTAEQKAKLEYVKTESMGAMKKVIPDITALKQEIIASGRMGVHAEALQEKVAKLAVLEAQATMIHLKCIEETKNILTKDQLLFLLSQKKRSMRDGQKFMNQNKCIKCKKRP